MYTINTNYKYICLKWTLDMIGMEGDAQGQS